MLIAIIIQVYKHTCVSEYKLIVCVYPSLHLLHTEANSSRKLVKYYSLATEHFSHIYTASKGISPDQIFFMAGMGTH